MKAPLPWNVLSLVPPALLFIALLLPKRPSLVAPMLALFLALTLAALAAAIASLVRRERRWLIGVVGAIANLLLFALLALAFAFPGSMGA